MKLAAAALSVIAAVLPDSANAQALYQLVSPTPEAAGEFGYSVAAAGDVNNDGCPDVIVGALGEGSWGGRAHVFSGAAGGLLHTVFTAAVEPWGNFGWSVSGAGDVNNDGHDDLLVGTPRNDVWQGRAFVFNGQDGASLYELEPWNPLTYDQRLGWSVSAAGDLNGDGHDDVIVGAIGEFSETGGAYLFNGSTGGFMGWFGSPNGEWGGGFGWSVAGCGIVNNDSIPDFVVGAPMEDPGASPTDAGRAYVFDGDTWGSIHTLVSPNEETSGQFGRSVSWVGDVDGDGYDDVVVGAQGEDPGASPDGSGRAYVFSGSTGSLLHTLVSPFEEAGGTFGCSVSGAGDVNGDGSGDVLVGAKNEDAGLGILNAGRAYVFSGATGDLLHVLDSPNKEQGGLFGCAVSGVGDVDGDSHLEILVGAYLEDPGSSPDSSGMAYVFTLPPVMELTGDLEAGAAVLQWPAYPASAEYWVYGADNEAYFEAGLLPPYEHRLAVLPAGTLTWSSAVGVGDPYHNWTYQVVAVNASGEAMCVSNRVGEHDFDLGD